MSVTIFFEGGGDKETTQSKCRRGLSIYCAKVNPKFRRLRVVASGGREQTFEKFNIALRNSRVGETVALLVDSEGPVTKSSAAEHLRETDRWEFANLPNHHAFLMVQCMESWFMADRQSLAAFYDGGFLLNSLPGSSTSIESIRKQSVHSALKRATSNTRTKGEYQKIDHGSALLAMIDPAKVEDASPHAKRFNDFLRSR